MTAGLPICGCFTYAVGECADCHIAVCGDHSQLVAGKRRCSGHAKAAEAVAAAEAAQRRQAVEGRASQGGVSDEDLGLLRQRQHDAVAKGMTEESVSNSYWFWRQRGYFGIDPVAAEFEMTVSAITSVINAAGKSGVLEARRPHP